MPELKERNAPEFVDQLAALSAAVEGGAGDGAVDAAFAEVVAALDAAAAGVEHPNYAMPRAIAELASTAAEKYAEGVTDGKLAELHEFQDARGCIQVARAYAEDLTGSDDAAVARAARTSFEQLQTLGTDFKGLVPPTEIGTDPSDLSVAAARVEFATVAAK